MVTYLFVLQVACEINYFCKNRLFNLKLSGVYAPQNYFQSWNAT